MSQKEDSEDDIWQYKSLGKRKKTQKRPPAVTKRRHTTEKVTSVSATTSEKVRPADVSGPPDGDGHSSLPSVSSSQETVHSGSDASSGDFCPMCQMPFSALVVQTQRWHVAECLDISRDNCPECPDGLQCTSTIPNHYKNFNHRLLAHSRASADAALLHSSQQAETSGQSSFSRFAGLMNNYDSELDTSQDTTVSSSVSSTRNNNTRTPPCKPPNRLLWLRSPGPEDLKKKKGWSPSTKSRKSITASQETETQPLSTAVKEASEAQVSEEPIKPPQSPESDDFISYSPLSELPVQTEDSNNECRKRLFTDKAFEPDDENSLSLLSDGFSGEDDLLNEFMDNMDTNGVLAENLLSSSVQLESVVSLAPSDQPPAAQIKSGSSTDNPCDSSFQSPQSIVLERLRESLPSSNSHATSQLPSSQDMPPQKGKSGAAQSSGLKQTDIGVFFGLKPLKQEKEAENEPKVQSDISTPTLGESSGHRRPRGERKERQRKRGADNTTTDTTQVPSAIDAGDAASVQGAARGGRTRGWRGRRNRVNADGEVQFPRCPFYKKIPGTKFTIDAFNYGEIEGITAYFLTHFHSDHYGGLTKKSTVPIYCNQITGNLVKSKLKVAEQYVHVLPMKTPVTVEGVKVVLLDANHCPGSAMLLFFLPDGQIVLHTGDFRADPSMETYPELLGCRVQTLYLDTTYCSPEYTFPRQQEVINFAANTAFELVTINPRTLVVCGSYSVGKEKVFLALADVLGSKVCLSRDKYNTMCCLESQEVKQRITTDWKAAQVHVLPMMQISFHKLQQHLARFAGRYDQLVAFKPTGWTFSQQVESVENIEPHVSGNVSIYGIPYSEHSSFLELKRFVQWLRPLKIIPTVNNGSWSSRKPMEKCFSDWLTEAKAKR